MAKYYGKIGFAESVETAPDVWRPQIVEYPYYGDILQNYRRLEQDNEVINDVAVSNRVSILADPYARNNFHNMRYICYMNAKWKVTNVEVQYPRLILSIGGEYNGEEPSESE